MKRCVSIGGMPGTGKTTLMKTFKPDSKPLINIRKLVTGHDMGDYIILGDYSNSDEVFAGSDRFSMAVQPEAEAFFKENQKNVIFEGDRIFNKKMLDFIVAEGYELLVIILEVSDKTRKSRYEARGSNQSEKFISGRETKCNNIKNNGSIPVYVTDHETLEDTKEIKAIIENFLKNGETKLGILKKIEVNSLDDFFG